MSPSTPGAWPCLATADSYVCAIVLSPTCRREGWRRDHEELTSREFILSRAVARRPSESGSARLAAELEAYESAAHAGRQYSFPVHTALQDDWLGQALCVYGYGQAAYVVAAVLDTVSWFTGSHQPQLYMEEEQLLQLLDELDVGGVGRWQRLREYPELRQVLPLLLLDSQVVFYHPGWCLADKLRLEVGCSCWWDGHPLQG